VSSKSAETTTLSLDRNTALEFIRHHGLAVVATGAPDGAPEAALVNIAVTDDLELIFYSLEETRKCARLRENPRIAVVIGWDSNRTLQYEGLADEPQNEELERLKSVYAAARPNASFQMAWPGLVYFRIKPKWLRLSDYGRPWSVKELVV
jgi:pyridoxine/pyridoxamine 5'-phosphate oxidase